MRMNLRYGANWTPLQRRPTQEWDTQAGDASRLASAGAEQKYSRTGTQARDVLNDWRDINRGGCSPDVAKGTQMYRNFWTARQERMNTFLTAEQQKAWNQMVGDRLHSSRPLRRRSKQKDRVESVVEI